jgi:CBS domain-containing protein
MKEKTMEQSIRDVMTPNPSAISRSASILDAAQLMRGNNIGDVIVLEDDRLFGILTDRDIVVRGLAERSDPKTIPVGEICSRDLTTIEPTAEPTASVEQAVRLMREKAIRRLPVVDESGDVMGIVSIGDVAVERDPQSALAGISAAPPNL